MRRMLTVRRSHAAFGRGALRFLYPKNRKILAYLREYQGEALLCVANVSRTPQAVELDLSEFVGRVPIELNGGSLFPPIGQLTYLLTLPPYGFYWFILAKESEAPSWHTPAPEPMPDYVTLVLRDGLANALKQPATSSLLERDSLPAYLAKRRWFSAKDQKIESAHLAYTAPLPGGDRELLLAEIETRIDGATQRWQMPLAIAWEDEPAGPLPGQLALSRGFANSPTMLGEVTRIDKQGERHSLAVVQAFIRNQGDGWTWTLNQFKRAVDDLATHEAGTEARADNVEDYKSFAATVGRQL